MNTISAKKIVTFVMGATICLVGFALLFLPGPGIAIIVGGLALLATEFVWARRWLRRMQHDAVNVSSKIVGEATLKKALGENFVENSKKEIAMDAEEAQETKGSHEADVPEPAPGEPGNQSTLEQDQPGSPTETNQELAAKFPDTTVASRPN